MVRERGWERPPAAGTRDLRAQWLPRPTRRLAPRPLRAMPSGHDTRLRLDKLSTLRLRGRVHPPAPVSRPTPSSRHFPPMYLPLPPVPPGRPTTLRHGCGVRPPGLPHPAGARLSHRRLPHGRRLCVRARKESGHSAEAVLSGAATSGGSESGGWGAAERGGSPATAPDDDGGSSEGDDDSDDVFSGGGGRRGSGPRIAGGLMGGGRASPLPLHSSPLSRKSRGPRGGGCGNDARCSNRAISSPSAH